MPAREVLSSAAPEPDPAARRLISADKVEGTAVYNRGGEHLGTIETLMIDKVSGRVAFAVMAFGGFLGLGESQHPLPWSVLTYDTALGGYVVDLTREQLEGAPTFPAEDEGDLTDTHGQRVYDYYKAEPFWLDRP
ncbi:PRC-barrel domain containing protein [Roseomonas nepalensis]|uniref:PRC-barrel domain containing protein n=1 Tax=Muricoccus nepalensis TaxID=1854500 RepID=A0A502EY07_9PROT|nr:PRC-barrel domain-containing protein [Roseomonas nepalensis]TPG41914.1 PRC-barrel domain containing protein [Roseomonas nepalensis]